MKMDCTKMGNMDGFHAQLQCSNTQFTMSSEWQAMRSFFVCLFRVTSQQMCLRPRPATVIAFHEVRLCEVRRHSHTQKVTIARTRNSTDLSVAKPESCHKLNLETETSRSNWRQQSCYHGTMVTVVCELPKHHLLSHNCRE